MTENDLYNILQGDDNLREAIRRREQKLPQMPDGLKERPLPLPLPREGRTKILRWIAAAACILLICGVGVKLIPSGGNRDEVMPRKAAVVQKETKVNNPQSEVKLSEAPKTVAIAKSKTIRKSKKKAVTMQTASIEQKDSSLFTLHSSLQKNDSSLFTLHSSLQKNDSSLITHNSSLKPAVLTERDIPITRPENYRYTPEEIALLKKQADDAYVKWVQLELEIAKHNLEQTANNYKEL